MYTVTECSDPMVPSREEIATEMDNLPEEPSLPGTALQLSQNTDSLTNLIELVKRTPKEIRAIEESTKGQAKMFCGMTTEKVLLQPQMHTLLKLPW